MKDILDRIVSDDQTTAISAIKMVEEQQYHAAVPVLMSLVTTTPHNSVRDSAAIALRELGEPRAAHALVQAILDDRTVGHRSTLVWACEEFDCSMHLSVFVDLVIRDSYGTSIEAYEVIKSMRGPFDEETIQEVLDKLDDVMEDSSISNSENAEVIEATREVIRGIATSKQGEM